MKFTELKNSIQEGKERIYLLEGEESFFTSRGVELLTSAFLSEPSLNYSTFEGSCLKGEGAKDFLSAVYAFPFLSEKRLVRVNEYYPTEKEFERVEEVFSSPVESTILVIVNSGKGKAGTVDLKKKKNVAFVDCGKATEEDVAKWIFYALKKAGIRAESSLCYSLGESCSFSMSRVSLETQKIISFLGEGGTLTQETIDSLVEKDADYKLYELTAAVGLRNYSRYLTIENDLLLKGYDELSFLSALGNYMKNLYDCLVSPLSDEKTAKALSMKEYAVKKNREQARRLGKQRCLNVCNLCYRAVNDMKGGRLTPESALALVNAKIFFLEG